MRRQDAPLREGQIAYICAGLLHALDYMHTEVKAIHRDIKVRGRGRGRGRAP